MLVLKRILLILGLIWLAVTAATRPPPVSSNESLKKNHGSSSSLQPLVGRLRSGIGKLPHHYSRASTHLSSDLDGDSELWFPIMKRKAIDSHIKPVLEKPTSSNEEAVDLNEEKASDDKDFHIKTEHHGKKEVEEDVCLTCGSLAQLQEEGQPYEESSTFASHQKHALGGEHGEGVVSKPINSNNSNMTRRGDHVYHLIKQYSGSTFFDDFHFFTASDPSGGMIKYLGKDEARSTGLIGTKNGNAFMKIDHGNRNGVQKSVRISTESTFTTGVIVLDAYHMPTGCGVWPAFWTTPRDPVGGWPQGGEIDLIEGVHYFARNMYSIHAPSWCSMPDAIDMLGQLAMPNKALAINCDPHLTSDQGCGVKSMSNGDYGSGYNRQGGGVHVLDWDSSTGIHAYFFPRSSIPSDIQEGNPKPWTWGTPKASWPSTRCKPDDYFKNHVAVFSNTVCGTWAGSSDVWNNAMGGQTFTCKAHTGKNSCYDYMNSGADLSRAYWEIKSLKIYQKNRRA